MKYFLLYIDKHVQYCQSDAGRESISRPGKLLQTVNITEFYLYIWRWRSRISAEAKNMADQATYSHEVFTDHS